MKTWFWLMALCAAPLAQAGDKLIFACTNAQGKQVRVIERDGMFHYRFGKAGKKPELAFANRREEAIARSPKWNGVGRELWTTLVLQNGQYQYALFSSMDRILADHPISYGIAVHRVEDGDTRYVSQIRCSKKHRIVADFPEEVMF